MGYDIVPNQPINLLPYSADACNIGDGREYCMLANVDDTLYLHIKQTPCADNFLCDPDFNSYGDEMLTNGDITGSAASWTLGANWAYGTDAIVHTPGSTATLSQGGMSFVAGNTYIVIVQTSGSTTGTVTATIGANIAYYSFRNAIFYITPVANETTLYITPTSGFDGQVDSVTVALLSSATCWTIGGGWTPSGCGMIHAQGSTNTLTQDFNTITGNVRFTITVSGMTDGTLVLSTTSAGTILTITENGTYQYNDFQFATYSDTLVITPSSDFDGCISGVNAYDLQGIPDGEVQQLAEDGTWGTVMDFTLNTEFNTSDGSLNITIQPDTLTAGCYRFVMNDQCSSVETLSEQMSPDIPLNNQAAWTNYNFANSSILVTGGAMEQVILANGAAHSSIAPTYNFPYTNGYYHIDWSLTTGDFDSVSIGVDYNIISLVPVQGTGGYDPYVLVADPSPNTSYSGSVLMYVENTGIYANKFFLTIYIDAGSGTAGDVNQILTASFILRNQWNADANEWTYVSNRICVDTANDCTKLIVGTFPDQVDSLGFHFYANNGFQLQQRLRFLSFNPVYPIEATDYEYSSGTRALTAGKREKYYEGLLDYMGETEHDTLSTQILCDTFTIDGVEYFVKPDEYKPEWAKDGRQRLAQARILLRKKDSTIYRKTI